jgi:hypothetical protein
VGTRAEVKGNGFQQTIIVASNNDPSEFMGAVRWDNTANYMKNANRPEQDAWFRELRSNLASDLDWFDGALERESIARDPEPGGAKQRSTIRPTAGCSRR